MSARVLDSMPVLVQVRTNGVQGTWVLRTRTRGYTSYTQVLDSTKECWTRVFLSPFRLSVCDVTVKRCFVFPTFSTGCTVDVEYLVRTYQ